MLDGLAHLRPLVNGNSAFMPRPFDRALDMLAGPRLDEEGYASCAPWACGTSSRVTASTSDGGRLRPGARLRGDPGTRGRRGRPGEPAPTRWTEAGALVDLGEPRRVSGVVFELGDGPWRADPCVRCSRDGRVWDDVEAVASLADATFPSIATRATAAGPFFAPERPAS
jgi:hypothetical protein